MAFTIALAKQYHKKINDYFSGGELAVKAMSWLLNI